MTLALLDVDALARAVLAHLEPVAELLEAQGHVVGTHKHVLAGARPPFLHVEIVGAAPWGALQGCDQAVTSTVQVTVAAPTAELALAMGAQVDHRMAGRGPGGVFAYAVDDGLIHVIDRAMDSAILFEVVDKAAVRTRSYTWVYQVPEVVEEPEEP